MALLPEEEERKREREREGEGEGEGRHFNAWYFMHMEAL